MEHPEYWEFLIFKATKIEAFQYTIRSDNQRLCGNKNYFVYFDFCFR